MFISFYLIVKYPWFLNQLSLDCGIVPGSGQTNDDVTSLMQICHNNNSKNSHSQRPHISNVHLKKDNAHIFSACTVKPGARTGHHSDFPSPLG